MHILVAGGAGFIGSHLCERLLKMRHRVICVDNLKTGRAANLETAKKSPLFRFLKHDIRRPFTLRADYIFHLASYASPRHYQKWSVETLMTNALGSYHLLEIARHCRAKYLFASTSEVYGDPLHHPQKESDWGNVNPVGGRACYDEAKRFAEALTMEYVRKHGLNARIIRIFNTYGPRLQPDDGRVVSNFINQALRGSCLTVYGSGRQTRSFCYVDDLVEGMTRAAFYPRTCGQVINLGNPKEFTILQAAVLVGKLVDKPLRTKHLPLPADDPQRRRPDISKARKLLGWSPEVSLRDGLRRTIAWYRVDGRGK
ncbi:SDR family oxidoreductase [candidate division FCPU426 bacterium]|nr:SDR family oxidoreductase [candidate division FCPU426 bacterium]